MELKFFAATDIGRQRDHNEDNFLVDKKLSLFVVADGMGGHASGEVASQIAVHEVSRVVRENADVIERYAKEHGRDRAPGDPGGARARGADRRARRSITAGRPSPTSAAWAPRPRRCSSPAIAASSPTSATAASTCCARPGAPADRGPLAHQRAGPARQDQARRDRHLALREVQERGHARGRRLRDASRSTRSTSRCCPAISSCSARTGCTPTSRTPTSPRS